MLMKTITFTDYNGVERTENHYFNLNKSELVKWLTTSGDYTLDKVLERLTTERDGKKIMDIFENLLSISYGRKSLDGRKFEKNDEIWKDFFQTEAYDSLFMELITDAQHALKFINGVIPKDLVEEIEQDIKNNPNKLPPGITFPTTT